MARHHTFLFAITSRTVLDAAVGGNDTRFINHSCAPNCDAVIEGGRVFIDACKPIAAGAELFYDYSYEREPDAAADVESPIPLPMRCAHLSGHDPHAAPPPAQAPLEVAAIVQAVQEKGGTQGVASDVP